MVQYYILTHLHLPGPVLLETYMSTVTSVQWNHTGSIIAFAGTQRFQDGKELCAVQFYNALGEVQCKYILQVHFKVYTCILRYVYA